jgi:hypothetical protein
MKKITKSIIEKNKITEYDLLNEQLYILCKKHFNHNSPDKILAKTLLIGRTYSAALDRGKDKNKTTEEKNKSKNVDFYKEVVVPIFNNTKIDTMLDKIKCSKKSNLTHLILETHKHLMDKLSKINSEDKRSFCSKYLHFHLPDLFFIYDVRAKSAINNLVKKREIKDQITMEANHDYEYEVFYRKAVYLQKKINDQYEIDVTPRELDNILLALYK